MIDYANLINQFKDAPKATHCLLCGKPLTDNSVFYINGEGFCNATCQKEYETVYLNKDKIQEVLYNTIPPLYRNTDIEKLPNPTKIKEILKWEMKPCGLFLWGDSGAGKTRTALELVKMLVKRHLFGLEDRTLKVFLSGSLRSEFEQSYANHKSQKFLDDVKNASLLMIDDFGKDKFTEAYESMIFNVIDYRVSYGLPTIITTNFVKDELKRKFTCEENYNPFTRRIAEFFKMYKLTK